MEDPNQEVEEEAEMPIPLNSTYGHGHVLHGHHVHMPRHHHHPHTSPPPPLQIPPIHHHAPVPIIHDDDDHSHDNNNNSIVGVVPIVKRSRLMVVRYRECLKNHAASIGGTANDGCGEFMPAGEDGTLEALTCSACSCHRNFHRKEIDHGDDNPPPPCNNCYNNPSRPKLFLQAGGAGHYHHSGGPRHQMIMSYNIGGGGGGSLRSESDEQDGGGGGVAARPPEKLKKRFRTKFSQEQKEKMLGFAERVGWKIQKQEESVVQSFCQEIGVKRRVLKVWMHNNKHTHHIASTNKNNTTNHDQNNQVE